MNRRELLLGAAAMASAAMAGRAFAAEGEHAHMGHEHQHLHPFHHDKLVAVAADCALKANLCLQHCIVSMGQGEKELAACAESSSRTAAICTALQHLASSDTKQLPQLARVVMDICKECEEECKKYEKHAECKACKESCVACYEECKKIAA